MQSDDPVDAIGLLIWIAIVVIGLVIRAIKAIIRKVVMLPQQNNTLRPFRQNQGGQGTVSRPTPAASRPMTNGYVSLVRPVRDNQPQLSQQGIEHFRHELQNEFGRLFPQMPHTEAVSAPQPVVQTAQEHREGASYAEYQQHGVILDGETHENGRVMPSKPIGVLSETSLQRRRRLREAYLLTELIGRPRAYDV